MSGAVAVGSLVVVIELGAPVASNLGLGLGTIPAGQGAAVSQALSNPTVPSSGLAAKSLANAPSSAPVAAPPTTPLPTSGVSVTSVVVPSVAPSSAVAEPAVAATSGGASSHVVAAPIGTATVPPTNDGNDGAAHASVLVDSPTSDHGVQSQDAQQGGHGQNGQHGQGNGGQGNGGANVPQGRALGHSH